MPVISRDAKICLPDWKSTDWKRTGISILSSVSDFNGGLYTQPGILEATIEGYLGNWEDIYGKNPNYTTIGTRFIEILRRAYEQTGRRAVVLIDEYDKPILDVLDTEALFMMIMESKFCWRTITGKY